MKALYCNDLMEGCDFVARGATEDEVMRKAAEHAKTEHASGICQRRMGRHGEGGDPQRANGVAPLGT